MRVLLTADWHIGGSRPLCRADEDWIETQRRDIESVWEIARAKKVESIWILGDLFDTSRASTEAVNLVLQEFEKAPCEVRVLCGNHDLPYHNFRELERSSIGIILHAHPMLGIDQPSGLVSYPFGTEPQYEELSNYMKANGMHTWATHQLTFPNEEAKPVPGMKGVIAQDLLDACPAASVVLTGDYHHGYIYTSPKDGRRVITPGCLNIQAADMKDYRPHVYIYDTFDLSAERVDIPVQGKVATEYLEREHQAEGMKAHFIATLQSGTISMKSFSEALAEKMPTLPEGVQQVLTEVMESLNAD